MQIRTMLRPLVATAGVCAVAATTQVAVSVASAASLPGVTGPGAITHMGLHAPGYGHGSGTTGRGTQQSTPLPPGTVTSTNWSGYAVTGNGPYTSVTTSWVQPAVNCSVTPNSYAAFWAGLDGYSSGTVEQDGTLAECVGRRAVYLAWYETYPNPMYEFGGTVAPGDALTSTVTSVSPTQFTLTVSDAPASTSTKPWSATTMQTVSSPAALSSAEVIAEAPSSGSRILPLADFGTVSFQNPFVNSTALSSEPGTVPIEMVSNRGAAEGIPSTLSGSGFAVSWR